MLNPIGPSHLDNFKFCSHRNAQEAPARKREQKEQAREKRNSSLSCPHRHRGTSPGVGGRDCCPHFRERLSLLSPVQGSSQLILLCQAGRQTGMCQSPLGTLSPTLWQVCNMSWLEYKPTPLSRARCQTLASIF